jgi:hypothetical protein
MFLMAWISAAADKLLVHFKDAVGRESTVGVYTLPGAAGPLATGPAAIVTGLAGVSDAVIHKAELLKYAVDDAPAAPVADPYDRPTDKLELVLLGEDGVPATIKLPSVKEAYYQADKATPLTSAGPAKTLIDLIKASCVTADGAPFATVSKARRMIPRRLRTWNKRGNA